MPGDAMIGQSAREAGAVAAPRVRVGGILEGADADVAAGDAGQHGARLDMFAIDRRAGG